MKRLKGMGKIFRFTFRQQVSAKGYRMAVIIGMVLCLALPAVIMACMELLGSDETVSEVHTLAAKTIYTVDCTEPKVEKFDFLEEYAEEPFDQLRFAACDSLEEAKKHAAEDDTSLILVLDEDAGGYLASILLPEGTALEEEDAELVESFVAGWSQAILFWKSGLDIGQLKELSAPIVSSVETGTENLAGGEDEMPQAEEGGDIPSEEDWEGISMAAVKEIVTYLVTYLNIMVIYFLGLFYGQAVAGNVLMEKTSKLMDTFLIAVRPEAMVFGKVLAIALSSILQFSLWIASLLAGFGLGSVMVHLINPESDMIILSLLELLGKGSGLFTVPEALTALLIVVGGFFLYCSLAAIGGSMAGKTEDLASTNTLFSLVLVASFLCVLWSGGIDSMGTSGASWQNWVPFMSILVTPARVLVGQATVPEGLASFAVTAAASALLLYLAGRIYKMMALYRGKTPKISQVLRMLRE